MLQAVVPPRLAILERHVASMWYIYHIDAAYRRVEQSV